MKLNYFLKSTYLIWLCIILSGCVTNLSPIEVSEKFWTAVKNKDSTTVRRYISSNGNEKNELTENILPLDEISLGRTIIDGEEAWVDTEVVIAGDEPFRLPLKTVLLKENQQWKVDYDATVASITKGSSVARVMGSLADLSSQFAKELDRSLDEIQKTLPEVQREIEKIEDSVKQQLPELKERLEEIIKQLEEALGGINKDRTSKGTTEI